MACIARQAWHEGPQESSPAFQGSQGSNIKAPVFTLETCYNVMELKRGRYSVISTAEASGLGCVCIKTYDRPSLVPKKQKMATREAIVLKYLNSMGVPHITHMWSAYASQDKFHILMEYCCGGNLLERLKAAAAPMGEQQLAAQVAAPLLRTLAAMHAAGVTHRDIKLENIFADAAGHPKLGDFDLAVFHHEAPTRAPVGTIFYMAPEVLLLAGARGSALEAAAQRRVGEKMDVWSLGVCLFELAAGYKPFQGISYEGIASAIIQAAMADLPPHLSSSFRSFIAAALTYDPAQRPTAQQLLDHPWIQQLPGLRLRHQGSLGTQHGEF
ncbi:hypothetical protein OEZ85_005888 [Tetradesmus obliquus]|uniref:Protein kinase domain-containing protein n=1 Tax=Tetradesmus obliquus TaxID=3088 RepID=A0ABY8UEX7_TETOB|nr:hypothetical protein OEZ85_005888 [Tetradesmus obliquus]